MGSSYLTRLPVLSLTNSIFINCEVTAPSHWHHSPTLTRESEATGECDFSLTASSRSASWEETGAIFDQKRLVQRFVPMCTQDRSAYKPCGTGLIDKTNTNSDLR